MLTRDELLAQINNTGLPSHLGNLQKAIIASATEMILGGSYADDAGLSKEDLLRSQDRQMLNSAGPAAASAAVDYAIGLYRNKLSHVGLTSSYIRNVQLIQNDTCYPDFSNTLRQFLLPRYALTDFDFLIDPKHRVDTECGYPKFITPIMYRYMYDRDDIARRIVDVYPNETWATDPIVSEGEVNREPTTPFEKRWVELCDDFQMLSQLYRLDRLSGIGHYGVLLMGIDDGKPLDQPIDEPDLLKGVKRSVAKKTRNLLYLRPFDEYLSFIQEYERDTNNPRYGMPIYYNLVFVDMTIDAAGASVGTRLNRRVHWTRVIHVADNTMSSQVFGIPRQQSVFNRELDLRKLKGGSAEMFWKGAFPGLSFEVDPKFVADNPEFNMEESKQQVSDYFSGLQRSLFLMGIQAKTLAPQIADSPENYIECQLKSISCSLEMPMRVFLGSEEGRVASAQDIQTWNKRLGRRCRLHVAPNLLRGSIDRFVAIGVMPPPDSKRYLTEWPDLDAPTDEDKANLSLKWTQALSQYVASGMIHLIEPMDYLTMILGLRPSEAKRIVDAVQAKGGFAKLMAVDPSQGAGVNGNRTDIAGGAGKGGSSDKQIQGMTSK